MAQKIAFITGITGQDGSYLAELLLAQNYRVHGLVRRASSSNTARIQHLLDAGAERDGSLTLHHGDMTDTTALTRLVEEIRPDEIYNLAAQSHVAVSFDSADYTANVDALGTLRLLEALRTAGLVQTCRFYQASTSELYGLVQETPQRETTPFHPRSPYAVAKLYAYWIVRNYREAHGLHGSNGILFNHESPRRGEMFVTRKITLAVGRDRARPRSRCCSSAISTPAGTGAMRAISSPACTSSCSRQSPTTMCWRPGRPTPSASSSSWRSATSAAPWCGRARAKRKRDSIPRPERSWWRSTRNSIARPRCSSCSAMPARRGANLAGRPRRRSSQLVEEMVMADVARNA